jgi:uncharacterized membrane protein
MKPSAGLRFKTYLLILVMVIFGPLGDVLLSKGMKDIAAVRSWAPADLFHFFVRAFTSGMMWLGDKSLLMFFCGYLLVLSWADYSYVQPASAIAYVMVVLLGYFALGEIVTATRCIGVLVICAGVFIVGHTYPNTTVHT